MKQKRNNNSWLEGLEFGESFPSRMTIIVGIWILVFSAISVIGLLWSFLFISRQDLEPGANIKGISQIQELLVIMFAAGVGSSVTNILGFLSHASVQKDFDPAYTPWYIARPVLAMLLGLIFYFVIKGGLIVLTAGNTTSGVNELNLWTLSAIGALVGLFSQNAFEKLRKLFDTLFITEADKKDKMNRKLLKRLPENLKDEVSPYLGGGAGEVEEIPKGEDDAV